MCVVIDSIEALFLCKKTSVMFNFRKLQPYPYYFLFNILRTNFGLHLVLPVHLLRLLYSTYTKYKPFNVPTAP